MSEYIPCSSPRILTGSKELISQKKNSIRPNLSALPKRKAQFIEPMDCAPRLHESNVQIEEIQEILRHSDPKVTRDSYIVVKSENTKKAMQSVGKGGVLKAWRANGKNSR